MVLMYLGNKPQVSEQIVQWLLLFIEYDFITMYKLGRKHACGGKCII
jgi:hypothetical protein